MYGFSGDLVETEGLITLPVTMGEAPYQITRMISFLVVNRPSVYNVIIGRPTLNGMRAVTSTYHLMMKFPSGNEIGTIRGNQSEARSCYVAATCGKEAKDMVATIFQVEDPLPIELKVARPLGELDPRDQDKERRGETAMELIDVCLDDTRPERVVKIGAGLPTMVQTVLEAFMREYKDVFAWSHEDMPGIDPEMIVHRLNVSPDSKPIIQKRRSFNPERYLAINQFR